MKTAGYPEELERWWVDRACRHYRVERLEDCARHLESGIQKLSDTFTVDRRDTFADYQRDPDLLLAYGLFFFPQNFVRVQFPLVELLARGWTPPHRAVRILDVGSGAGAAGFGAAAQLLSAGAASVTGCATDRSQSALQVHHSIGAIFPQQAWIQSVADLRQGVTAGLVEDADLILVSFSLNELGSDLGRIVDNLLARLHPQGMLLILEPSLKETSERLEALRDRIAAASRFHIWAPCLHSKSCPLLQEGKYWCHEVRKWSTPGTLNFLNRHLHRSADVLKFSFLAVSPAAPPAIAQGPQHFRLIAPFTKARGKWIGAGCAADGLRHEYELLKRDLTAEVSNKIDNAERGDILHADTIHPAGAAMRLKDFIS